MMKLTPQMIMLAIFPSDPISPALRIPHSGLTPTGAVAALEERPVNVVGECFWSCRGWRESLLGRFQVRTDLTVEEITPRV